MNNLRYATKKINQTTSNAKPEPYVKFPKVILYTRRLLQTISITAAAKFGARLFTTPLKHKMTKREYQMDKQSKQTTLSVTAISKTSL